MADRARPFWIHQLAEYLLGVVLVSQGLQAPRPLVPTLLGMAMLMSEGVARGPLALAPKVRRETHRIVDAGVLAALLGTLVLAGSQLNDPVRYTLIGVSAVHAFLLWRTNYATPVRRERRVTQRTLTQPGDSRSEDLGRTAGRAAGSLYKAVRQRKRP